jgi:hypothetical protein
MNQQRQRIMVLVCSPPKEGRARWTAGGGGEAQASTTSGTRDGPNPVRSHDLKPWREKCGARPNWMRKPSLLCKIGRDPLPSNHRAHGVAFGISRIVKASYGPREAAISTPNRSNL